MIEEGLAGDGIREVLRKEALGAAAVSVGDGAHQGARALTTTQRPPHLLTLITALPHPSAGAREQRLWQLHWNSRSEYLKENYLQLSFVAFV